MDYPVTISCVFKYESTATKIELLSVIKRSRVSITSIISEKIENK